MHVPINISPALNNVPRSVFAGAITYVPVSDSEVPSLSEEAAGKGLKKILGVVASFIVPFAAPVIAGAIGISGAIGTALVGAGLGAATSALTGGNPLLGAITGGIGGYFNAPGAGLSNAAGTSAKLASMSKAGLSAPAINGVTKAADIASMAATGTPVAAASNALKGGLSVTGTGAVAQLGVGQNTMNALRNLGGNVLQRFSTPEGMAALTRMAAGLMAPEPGLDAAIAARQQELAQERQQNEALYNLRLNTAQKILAEADYYNPENAGMQASSDAAQRVNNEEEDALRRAAGQKGYSTGKRQLIRRQAGLARGREQARAYVQGANTAADQRTATRNSALPWLPTSASYGTNESVYLQNLRDQNNQQAADGFAETIGGLSTLFTGRTPQSDEPPWANGRSVWGS